jgi:hypothetical protein
MTILFRACIQQTKMFDNDPLTKTKIEGLSGFVNLRNFAGDQVRDAGTIKRFTLFEFQLDNHDEIGDINAALVSYVPTYCFAEVCPRPAGDWQCPAVRQEAVLT